MANAAAAKSRIVRRRETAVSYLFLLPALAIFVCFVVTPMLMGLVTSFTDSHLGGMKFTGLANYIRLFQDPKFLRSAWNTVFIVLVSVPAVTAFSLWVGASIYRMRAGVRSFFRCVFYLPVVTGSVAVVVVWKWMFNTYNGLFNYAGITSGLMDKGIDWLGSPSLAIWCILIILFTTSIGQPIVLYVAALGNVDGSLVEAAEVDGATDFQTFWKIKWPSIMPTTLYVVVITTINSFQCFALIQLLTSGGPNYHTSTVMYLLYETAFKTYQYGYADAMGVILALVIALFSALQFKVMNGGTAE
jgi:multiple sugar transport system permease protein